jgi:hypothetical protein
LNEIELLRRKYEVKPRLITLECPKKEKNKTPDSFSISMTPFVSLRQRVCDNKRQKSFLALAKWTVCDAKKFAEKIQRLKGLLDDLENVLQVLVQATGITRSLSSPLITTSPDDYPPPPRYSSLQTQALLKRDVVVYLPTQQPLAHWVDDRSIFQHYAKLKIFLALSVGEDIPKLGNARTRFLSNNQLNELRVDVYDEFIRRRQTKVPLFLRPNYSNPIYSPVRNEVRRRLSSLSDLGFRGLALDLVFELGRRYPCLKESSGHMIDRAQHLPDQD